MFVEIEKAAENSKFRCYWYKDLIRDKRNHWHLSIAFQFQRDKPTDFIYPIGALPNFRLGRSYQRRRDVTNAVSGTLRAESFSDFSQGKLVNAWPVAKDFFNFYRDKDIGKQWLWQIKADYTTYYVPCVELLRALFIPNSTFARALFRPSGLAEISPPPVEDNVGLHFDFFPTVPIAAVNTKPTLRLLAWLHLDAEVKKAWQAVYRNHASARHRDKPSIPLKFQPPAIKNIQMKFRGIAGGYEGDKFLVLEIEQISLPALGVDQITYSHPKVMKKIEVERESGYTRTIVKKSPTKKEIIEFEGPTKSSSNVVVVKTPATVFEMKEDIHIKAIATGDREIGIPKKLDKSKPPAKTMQKTVSAGESSIDGEPTPIEFKSIGARDLKKDDGLYAFCSALNTLQKANPTWIIKTEFFELQGDSRFCFAHNRRRRCLLAGIQRPSSLPVFFLEVERTGGVMLSTLILKEKCVDSKNWVVKAIQAIVNSLERRGGRWPEAHKSWVREHFAIERINHPFAFELISIPEKVAELVGKINSVLNR